MELNKFIEHLHNLASDKEVSQYEIEEYIRRFYMYKPHNIVQSDYSHYCRASINDPGEIFKHVSRCSYNPNAEKIKLQRCNYPNQQVFYASVPIESRAASCSTTAILETAWEHIENYDLSKWHLTLSRWITVKPLNLFILPYSKLSIEKNDVIKIAKENFEKVLNNTFDLVDESTIQYFRDSLEFMSNVFCEKKNKEFWYRISSAFYNCMMNFDSTKKANIDGLIYPSANTEAAGLNVVLSKERVDKKEIVCDYVMMYELQRNPTDYKNIRFLPISNPIIPNPDGSINFNL